VANITFWFIAGLTVTSAFFVVSSKSLLYSAYSLLITFLGVTALYIFLWADFLAVVQVVVYVGGILVLIIFGIMLTNKISSVNISHNSVQKRVGAIVVIGFLGVLSYVMINTPWVQLPNAEPLDTTRAIGKLLMIDYLLPFEAASFLLLGALIGATTLSRKDD
jgi:NADH-quinone oxidoreductase subunit J|tara:strand:- start:158 stop:646 length:489 start_codon:yes stop_codon:yes gene_type:complete